MPYIGNNHIAGDHTNNFKVLDDISSYTATFDGSATSVVDTTNNTIRVVEHRFIQGQRVTYTNGGGGNIGGLTTGTAYFVIFDSASTIKLATNASNAANSTAINLSAVGTGSSHTINAAFDGVNTKFKLTHGSGTGARLNNATQINIAINNVVQRPNLDPNNFTDGFALEDNHKIVFQTAPTSEDIFWGSIIANTLTTFDISDHKIDTFTGDGSTTEFNLSHTPANNESLMVTINGVLQHPSNASTARAYTLIANVIQFTAAPGVGDEIQVRHLGFAGATTADVSGFYGRTGNVVLTDQDDITVNKINVGTGVTIESNGQATFVGVVTFGSGSTTIDNNVVNVGTALTLGHTQGLQFHTQNLHSAGFEINQINASGIITASQFVGNIGGNPTFSGDTTFNGSVSIGGTLTYEDVTNIDSIGIVTARDGIDCNGDIDVDGHTNLDNVSIAGVTTFSDDVKFTGANYNVLWDKSDNSLKFDALAKIKLNDSFQFYHNTNGVLHNTSGTTYIYGSGSGAISLMAQAGSQNISCNPNANTSLYYANGQKLYTVSDGVYINDNLGIQDSIQHILDTNTKIRFPAADTVTIETAGSERLRINSTGITTFTENVFLSKDLDVDGHTNLDNVSISGISSTGNIYITTGGDGRKLSFAGDGSSHYIKMDHTLNGPIINGYGGIAFETYGTNERLRITSAGKVGINTTSPGRMMHIFSGTTGHPVILERGDTSNTQIEMKTGGATRGFMGCSTTANFMVYDNDASDIQFQVLQNGQLLAGTTSGSVTGGRALILSKSDGARIKLCRDASGVGNGDGFELVMAADDRAYIWNRESQDMLFGTSGTERLVIRSGGNIGVGGSTGTDFSLLDGMVVNTGNGKAGLIINSSSSSHNAYITFGYGTDSSTSHNDQYSAYIGRIGDNTLILGTNNSPRVYLGSTGNLGLGGQTSPSAIIHIQDFSSGGYEQKLTGNALQFKRNSLSYIDQVHDDGSIMFRTKANNTNRLLIESDGTIMMGDAGAISGSGVLHLYQASNDPYITIQRGAGDTGIDLGGIIFRNNTNQQAMIKAYQANINTCNINFHTNYAGSFDNRFMMESTGSFIIQGNVTDEKIILAGSSQPYIRWREGNTNKAYMRWNSAGYLGLYNQEDGSVLRLKDTLDFSKDGSTFYNVAHTGNYITGGENYTSYFVGTSGASTSVRDTEKTRFYKVTIDTISLYGGVNYVDIMRAGVHSDNGIHGMWVGSMDVRIKIRTSNCGNGSNYSRIVHNYHSNTSSVTQGQGGGNIARIADYLACGESSRLYVWLRGQLTYQIRINGRPATIYAIDMSDYRTSMHSSVAPAGFDGDSRDAYSIMFGHNAQSGAGRKLYGTSGGVEAQGNVSATGSKPFKIPHPLVGLSTTKNLVHAAIEGPQCDNIYRGKTTLVAGISTVNIDTNAGMTDGTFATLNRDIQCFTTNETGWTPIKGSVSGNQLTILAQDNSCTDTISWMVVGERQDDNIINNTMTDSQGHLIVEPDFEEITEPDDPGTFAAGSSQIDEEGEDRTFTQPLSS